MANTDPGRPVSIILAHASWQTILLILGQRPWHEVDPLMQDIRRQIAEKLLYESKILPMGGRHGQGSSQGSNHNEGVEKGPAA